jgi:hypothetical protein
VTQDEFQEPSFQQRLLQRLEDLSNRLKAIEQLEVQQQFDLIASRLSELEQRVLRAERGVRHSILNSVESDARLIIAETSLRDILPSDVVSRNDNCLSRVQTPTARSVERIRRVTDDESIAVISECLREVNEVLSQFGMGTTIRYFHH